MGTKVSDVRGAVAVGPLVPEAPVDGAYPSGGIRAAIFATLVGVEVDAPRNIGSNNAHVWPDSGGWVQRWIVDFGPPRRGSLGGRERNPR